MAHAHGWPLAFCMTMDEYSSCRCCSSQKIKPKSSISSGEKHRTSKKLINLQQTGTNTAAPEQKNYDTISNLQEQAAIGMKRSGISKSNEQRNETDTETIATNFTKCLRNYSCPICCPCFQCFWYHSVIFARRGVFAIIINNNKKI